MYTLKNELNICHSFYGGTVFQTMTLPDEVMSTTKDGFVNDVYSSEPYIF